ncbi:Ig-like domain-containing protein [Fibrobacterota bacterium]
MFRRLLLLHLLLISFTAFLCHCAHIERPPGGPEDTESPFITAVYPEPGSLNQPRRLNLKFEFSEWILKDLAQNKVFISPALSQKLQFKVKGNLVEITSGSLLDSNTTYILSVSNSVSDLHRQKIKKSYNLIFSTGSQLDTVQFSGLVQVEKKSVKNLIVGLYPTGASRNTLQHLTEPGEKVPDSLPHPGRERPMYLIPADSNGVFAYTGFRPGSYSVLAFQDQNNNLRPDIGAEEIGIGDPAFPLNKAGTIGLRLAPYDTVPPVLLSALWLGEKLDSTDGALETHGIIQLKFSKKMSDETVADINNFLVIKSDSSDTMKVFSSCFKPKSPEIELWTSPLTPDSLYIVKCLKGTDLYSNPIDSQKNIAYLTPVSAVDSLPARVFPLSFSSGDSSMFLNRPLEFFSSKLLTPSQLDIFKEEISCRVNGDSVSILISLINHHTFALILPSLPYEGQEVVFFRKFPEPPDSISLPDSGAIKPAEPDSTALSPAIKDTTAAAAGIKARGKKLAVFYLADKTRWGKCKVIQDGTRWRLTLAFKHLPSSKEYIKNTGKRKRATIDSLPDGPYLLSYFKDDNNNRRWDPGHISPWTSQEISGEIADTLTIEAGETKTVTVKWPPEN